MTLRALRLSLLASLLIVNISSANTDSVNEEYVYDSFVKEIKTNRILSMRESLSPKKGKLLVDALWDLVDEQDVIDSRISCAKLERIYSLINPKYYIELLRINLLQKRLCGMPIRAILVGDIKKMIESNQVKRRMILTLLTYEDLLEDDFGSIFFKKLKSIKRKIVQLFLKRNSSTLKNNQLSIKFLVDNSPDYIGYRSGRYSDGVRLFMFCRQKRKYPCRLLMKDKHNRLVRDLRGEVWSLPLLAAARTGYDSHKRNGNTPAGIFTIDSVMPKADKQKSFGKFRRLILNFVKPSKDESNIKEFLPRTEHNKSWWHQTVIARDNGRNLFRVHGTLRKNSNPLSSHFPFVKTAGCVAVRENKYGLTEYIDQRKILDQMMRALDLEPTYENERKIKGFLTIIEINNKKSSVKLREIKKYLKI